MALQAPRGSWGRGGGSWLPGSILATLFRMGLLSKGSPEDTLYCLAMLAMVRDTSIQPDGIGKSERLCPKPRKHSKYQSAKPDEKPRGGFLGEDELKLCHCFLGGKVPLGTENPVLSARP